MIKNKSYHPASFKDNEARVLVENGVIYREIYQEYFDDYKQLMNSGLYAQLVNNNMLVKHETVVSNDDNILLIKPEPVFISYPYEWSFSQLKDAALLTLKIQEIALRHNMVLKDANAYNVQFHNGKPIFIDTTSFETYKENSIWVAYNQFVRNFVAPLALMAYKDVRLIALLEKFKDGIDLDLTSSLLPKKTFFDLNMFLHIHQHALFTKSYSTKYKKVDIKYSRFQMETLIDSLKRCVNNLTLKKQATQWDDYYNITNYSDKTFELKKNIINLFKKKLEFSKIIDFGANNGYFSRFFSNDATQIICADIDINAVEQNYRLVKQNGEQNILPLVFDLCNPTPAIGWNNTERQSFFDRVEKFDLVVALAFVHHIAIGCNVPLREIAKVFAKVGEYLIVEFVGKEDSQVRKLLCNRKDIFSQYTKEGFETSFGEFYDLQEVVPIEDTCRILYLMKRKCCE